MTSCHHGRDDDRNAAQPIIPPDLREKPRRPVNSDVRWQMHQPDSITNALRKYWKNFAPMWFVPVVMMADTIRQDIFGTRPPAFIINGIFILFFASFACWAWLPFTNRIRQFQAFILGMLLPFFIWFVLVMLRRVVIYAIH